jgi:LysR family hydrogen peroxide-inducible transcriptional activator
MTLTQLSYVVAVDTWRHFATAADKSFVTQPTLSMQIQKLEDELGVILFDRTKTPVVPTPVGEQIIHHARQLLKDAKHIEDLANLSDTELKGIFRVGVIPTIAPYLIPLFLRNFMQKYPKVELVFQEVLTGEVISHLENDSIDLGIIATPVEQSYIYIEDLYIEPFVGYLSANHPLINREKLTVEALDQSKIWLLNEGHCFRDQMVKLCKHMDERTPSPIQFESGNLETLKKLVEQNFGMTLLPILAVQEFDKTCNTAVIKEFDNPVPSRKVRLAYSRKYLKENIISAFKEEILANIPEILKISDQRVIIE